MSGRIMVEKLSTVHIRTKKFVHGIEPVQRKVGFWVKALIVKPSVFSFEIQPHLVLKNFCYFQSVCHFLLARLHCTFQSFS